MNCSPHCFNDREISGTIHSISQKRGTCDFFLLNGEKVDTIVVDTSELKEMFGDLIKQYKPDVSGKSIFDLLQEEWNIFNLDKVKATELLNDMFRDDEDSQKLLQLTYKAIKDQDDSEGLVSQWGKLKEEIKLTNRFFLQNVLDFSLLEQTFINLKKTYISGSKFYRGRISEKCGLPVSDLGKPLPGHARAGRANPLGIPYLYLCKEVKTVLHEIRAAKFDYISIGEFTLEQEINVVSFRAVNVFSPFLPPDLIGYLKASYFLGEVERDLSKALRRYDSDLDYLPTQYICEFVKSLGFDGVEYGSSRHDEGINLAIFNDDKINCTNVKIVEIKDISIIEESVN